jgi:hypothetical protein
MIKHVGHRRGDVQSQGNKAARLVDKRNIALGFLLASIWAFPDCDFAQRLHLLKNTDDIHVLEQQQHYKVKTALSHYHANESDDVQSKFLHEIFHAKNQTKLHARMCMNNAEPCIQKKCHGMFSSVQLVFSALDRASKHPGPLETRGL